jgi:sec-independent protein translocase protein TatB
MFDIGFSELLVIGVVALLVIGPERLPKVARTAGVIFGRFQRYVANVKGDIQRELDASEISRLKTEVQDAARSFEQNVNEQVQSVDSSAKELEQSPPAAAEAVPTVADANAPASISPPVPAAAADQVAAPAPTAESRPAA